MDKKQTTSLGIDSFEGITSMCYYLIQIKKECEKDNKELGLELALLINSELAFSKLFVNVMDQDIDFPYEDLADEMNFIFSATEDEICDAYFETDPNIKTPFKLIANEYKLYNDMMSILGQYAAQYITSFCQIQQLNLSPFIEGLVSKLAEENFAHH